LSVLPPCTPSTLGITYYTFVVRLYPHASHLGGRVIGVANLFENIDNALNRARSILGLPPEPKPPDAVFEVARERRG
jgi:hypothetical protein